MNLKTARPVALRAISMMAATALVLMGCANPYVRLEVPDSSKTYPATTLPAAFEYARSAHRAYREKVLELGDAERNLSNGLIMLGALTLAEAVAKVHPSTIAGTSILGGTAYTLGVFNTDKRRAIIYIAGMKAFECAMDAVTPLNFGDEVLQDVRARSISVQGAITMVARRIGEVEAAIQRVQQGGGDASSVIKGARDAIEAAQTVIGRANQAITAGIQLIIRHSQAGGELRNAVDKIDTAVVDELRGTEAAIQAVPGIIAGLAKNNEMFAGVGKIPDAPASGNKSDTPMAGQRSKTMADEQFLAALLSSVAALKATAVILDSDSEQLRGIVAGVEQKTPFESLKACKVDGLKTGITVSPQVVLFTAKTAGTQTILIDGGNNSYQASFLQRPTPGLSVEVPPRSKGVVEIIATDKTEAGGRFQLMIADTTGQSTQIVNVEIKDTSKTGGGGSEGDAATALGAAKAIIENLGTIDIAGVKVTILKPVTLNPDNKSIAVTYKVEDGKTVTDDQVRDVLFARNDIKGKLGDDKKQIVAAATPAEVPQSGVRRKSAPSLAWGQVVLNLDRQQVALIQSRLCLPARDIDGIWGKQTQATLRTERAGKGEKGTSGERMLTEQEAQALLNMSTTQAASRCKS